MAFLSNPEWTVFKEACLENGVIIERVIKSFYRRTLKPTNVAFDVGAHIGYHTSGLAEQLSAGVVVACEANPQTYLTLLKTILDSDFQSKVLTINAAIQDGKDRTEVTFNVSEDHPGRSGILESWSDLKYEKRTVTARTIDSIYKALSLSRLDFLKCDVEGTEWEALLGAGRVVEEQQPIIVLEHAHRDLEGYRNNWLQYFSERGLIPYFPNGEIVNESNFSDFWYVFAFPNSRAEQLLHALSGAVKSWKTL